MNKDQERRYVEQVAPALGWVILKERESPDFIIGEGKQSFGLELTEVFNGPIHARGATLKKGESTRRERIEIYQKRYAELGGPPLSVKIVGDASEATMDQLIKCLTHYDFESISIGDQVKFQVGEVTVFVTKALQPHWQSVDDTVGWVNRYALAILQSTIAKKATRLGQYQNAVGSDVRLLVVADHLHASGMLSLEPGTTIGNCGFHTVYFFPYPQDVQILECSSSL